MIERTLALIKPDAVARGLVGELLAQMQGSGLRLAALKMIRLSKAQAETFTPSTGTALFLRASRGI